MNAVCEYLPAFVFGKQYAAVEGVYVQVLDLPVSHEEVPGHPDSQQRHLETPADLHVNDGEGYGNAHAPFENLVEVAVAGVVVVVRVAPETYIVEEMLADYVDAVQRIVIVQQLARNGSGETLEREQFALYVQLRILRRGQQHRGSGDVNLVVRPVGDFGELA